MSDVKAKNFIMPEIVLPLQNAELGKWCMCCITDSYLVPPCSCMALTISNADTFLFVFISRDYTWCAKRTKLGYTAAVFNEFCTQVNFPKKSVL